MSDYQKGWLIGHFTAMIEWDKRESCGIGEQSVPVELMPAIEAAVHGEGYLIEVRPDERMAGHVWVRPHQIPREWAG